MMIIFGDWGLGIGDWAQSPIPNPQSPLIVLLTIYNPFLIKINLQIIYFLKSFNLN